MAVSEKSKKKKSDKKKLSPMEKRAKRDIRIANKPALNELRRQKRQAGDTYEETDRALEQINQALMNQLANIPSFGEQFTGISEGLNQNLGQLGSVLGSSFGVGSGESQAASNLFGMQGAGAQGLLANQQARNLGYSQSVKEQGAVDLSNRRINNLETYNDLIDEIKQGRLDIQNLRPDQYLQRIDELRARKQENKIAKMLAGDQLKTSQFNRSQTRRSNRQDRRAQDVATGILTDEQKRRALQQTLRQTNRRLGNVKEKLSNTDEFGNPIPNPEGGFDVPPNPKFDKLTDKKQVLRKKKRRTKRKLRSL